MVRVIMGILLLANFSIAMNDSPRIIQTINNHWTFNYFPHEKQDTRFKEKSFDDSKWQAIAIPHTWQTYETTGDVHPFISSASERDDPYWWHGWGWYRKHFIIPDKFKDKKIFIEFDGVQKSCDVWINGQKLGSHQGGFTTFYFDLTQHIRFGQKNIIAVAVSNRRMDPFRTPPMTAGNWNVYGGIYRDVRLVMKEKVHIPFQGSYKHEGGTFITTPVVNDTSAKVHIQTWVKNEQNSARDVTLISTILDSSDQIIAQIKSTRNIQQNELAHFVQESANIECPHLWSPENPYVYQVVSQVYVDDTKLDQMSSPLGFRWFWWNYTDNRLYLNGEPQHIHGTCLIPDYPWLGEAMPRWLLEKDLYDIRYNLNHNAIRPHVATAAPYVYDWCDRHGLLSVEEVPNFKRIDFSEQIQKQMTLEMIRRDRNHPSIFMWSVGNETTDASDTKWVVEQDTTRIVHARNIYNDSAGDFVDHTGQNMNLENLLRCTVRGWTHKDVMDLEPEINQHTGHEEHQHRMARIMGKSQRGRIDMISGLMFCYSDYGCDREYKNCPLKHLNPKGWVDAYRIPKYMYYLYQANYAEKPMVFIHPHYWQQNYINTHQNIVVDSNCDQVELFIDGKSMGVKYPSWQNFFTVTFRNIPIQGSVLKAVGKKCDTTVLHSLPIPGKPAQLLLESSHDLINANRASVVVVKADIIDRNGHHVYGANNTLSWKVEGPASWVGPTIYTSDRQDHEKMQGVMYIDAPVSNIVRSNGIAGEIIVTVESPGLAADSIRITAVKSSDVAEKPIIEIPLVTTGRQKTKRDPAFLVAHSKSVSLFNPIDHDIQITGQDVAWQLSKKLQELNPNVDPRSSEFNALHKALLQILGSNQGRVVADDYNFLIKTIAQRE